MPRLISRAPLGEPAQGKATFYRLFNELEIAFAHDKADSRAISLE